MVSLGDLCFANQLDATRVESSNIRAKNEFHIGNDTHNEIRMYHYGSILYYHYVQDIECANVTSYTGSSTVSVTLNYTPTVKQWITGDSIHLTVVSTDSSTASPASGAASGGGSLRVSVCKTYHLVVTSVVTMPPVALQPSSLVAPSIAPVVTTTVVKAPSYSPDCPQEVVLKSPSARPECPKETLSLQDLASVAQSCVTTPPELLDRKQIDTSNVRSVITAERTELRSQ